MFDNYVWLILHGAGRLIVAIIYDDHSSIKKNNLLSAAPLTILRLFHTVGEKAEHMIVKINLDWWLNVYLPQFWQSITEMVVGKSYLVYILGPQKSKRYLETSIF